MTAAASAESSSPVVPLFIGIDVAKDKLDLARSDTGQVGAFTNDAPGWQKLIESFAAAPSKPTLIVVEATGGYEQGLLDALLDAGLPVARVNPGRVRHFAQAQGILAKTDRIDAAVLLEFARHIALPLAQKRSENQSELEALVTCRRQLIHVRTEQTNRRGRTTSTSARKSIDAVLKELARQIKSLDKQIQKLIDCDDDFKHLNTLLRSVPGIAGVLSSTLIAELPELGHGPHRRIAALVGVAPFNRDSGRFQGKRAIRGGRASIRSALYLAALAASRFNPVIRVFAQRLKATGKANKVVIVACMRKLLSFINAMIRDGLTWDQLNVVRTA
jgi:transposase